MVIFFRTLALLHSRLMTMLHLAFGGTCEPISSTAFPLKMVLMGIFTMLSVLRCRMTSHFFRLMVLMSDLCVRLTSEYLSPV